MQFDPIIKGAKFLEIYHMGFNGTHFQIFLRLADWPRVADLMGKLWERIYLSYGKEERVTPSQKGGSFGILGCAHSQIVGDVVRIEIPAFPKDDKTYAIEINAFAGTMDALLRAISYVLMEYEKAGSLTSAMPYQLFDVGTMTCENSRPIFLTVSSFARTYLEKVGEGSLEDIVSVMEGHYRNMFNDRSASRWDFRAKIGKRGVLSFHTQGKCACLSGVNPEYVVGGNGYYLHSHNVDSLTRQFNILVGVASVWQMVRDGLVGQSKK